MTDRTQWTKEIPKTPGWDMPITTEKLRMLLPHADYDACEELSKMYIELATELLAFREDAEDTRSPEQRLYDECD